MDTKTYAVVDLETTGHSSRKGDRIIQIAIVLIKNGEVIDRYMRFVNPGHTIPPFIRELTNIYDEDVADAPTFSEIAAEVRELLEGTVFVAHNTGFDLPFLQNEFTRCGISKWQGHQIDTVELSKIVFPSLPSYRLQDISESLGISLPAAHRADDDAEATGELLRQCFTKLHTLPVETLQLLHKKSFNLKSDLSGLFYAVLKNCRHKKRNISYAKFRGIPYKEININKAELPSTVDYPKTNEDKIEQLRKIFPNFEKREVQFQFMDYVEESLSLKKEVALEEPTGIGKTIGYLLPAAIQAIQTNQPVVISTYTNYLVDKIVTSELEKVSNLLNVPITSAVIKGKHHYISLKKFEELLTLSEQSYDETFSIMQILVWLTETTTGDLNELTVSGGGQLFIDRIRSRTYALTEEERNADYFLKHMEASKSAHFIVTNHAMLLSDMHRKETIFDNIAGVIVDEAHQLVHTANQFRETVFSYTDWKYVLGQLGANGEGQLFPTVIALLENLGGPVGVDIKLIESYERFTNTFDEVTNRLAYYSNPENPFQGNRQVFSLAEFANEKGMFTDVLNRLSTYLEDVKMVEDKLLPHFSNMSKSEQALVEEWSYWVRELTIKASEWVEIFLETKENHFTAWIESDRRSLPSSLLVVRHPLDSTDLISQLTARFKRQDIGIVWTSGTFSIGDNKRYIPAQLGLDESIPVHLLKAPSSFYDGAKMYIVDDMPDIQQVSQSDYILEVANAITQATISTGGRLFVLFTSKDMLRKTYELIVESEQLAEYPLFAQGITGGSRMKLLKSFSQFKHSVLFGTSSFWEGVDVPGDALSAIIVVRLPFASPEDPVFKAKAAQMTTEGKNSFQQYALPEAVLRLRQGFGRLIRSSHDQGAFIVLDRRIETKSYGKQFIEALPKINVAKVSLEQMVKELESCYNRK